MTTKQLNKKLLNQLNAQIDNYIIKGARPSTTKHLENLMRWHKELRQIIKGASSQVI